MKFEVPLPHGGRPIERPAPGRLESRWSQIGGLYRFQDRLKFENYLASITQRRRPGASSKPKVAPSSGKTPQAETLGNLKAFADRLLQDELASPKGVSILMPWDSGGIQTYLNLEGFWRSDPQVTYQKGEWRVARETEPYQRDLELLRKLKGLGARSIDEVLNAQRSDADRERLKRTYKTASMRGDFTFGEEGRTLSWEGLRRAVLAMGTISESQYGVLATGLSLQGIQAALADLKAGGRICPVPDQDRRLPPRYSISEAEARSAIAQGDLDESEWDQSAPKRVLQRDHDEAVGDAMILMATIAGEVGLDVKSVVPEHTLVQRKMPPPIPDFIMEFDDGFGTFQVSCEVMGKGGGYRQQGFQGRQKQAGHMMYHPPYLGGGAHFS